MTDEIYGDRSSETDSRDEQRRELLEAAEALLSEEGRGALSVRRIAERSDVSTQMIYTLFGGKSGLLRELFLAGFDRFADYLAEVPDELPSPERLGELGRAYRRFALDHPALYRMMMGPPTPDFERPRAARDRETRAFEILESCILECVEAGHYRDDVDPREIADVHWAMVHGAVGLELAGFYDDPETAEERFELALVNVASGFST